MAQRGRTIEGPKAVENMEGSEGAKQRLQVVLETISGTKSIQDACTELGIGRSAFYDLRQKALEGALGNLEPGLPGRPRTARDEEGSRVAELEQKLTSLKIELEASRIREELAIAMPHVLESRQEHIKKKQENKKKAKRKQQRRTRKR